MLGVTFNSYLKWHSHVAVVTKRANMKLWLLRRLKGLGAASDKVLDLYFKQVRSVLEYASPLWATGLTSLEREELERVQKKAL